MTIKAKSILKKLCWVLLIMVVLFSILFYWISEPYNGNPFKELPPTYCKSEVRFDCEEEGTFKLKADSILNNAMKLNDFTGVSTGYYTERCGSWYSTAGFKNKGKGIRSDKNTLFRLASISKPFTAIAIMQLVEKGLLDLDGIVQSYLPDYPISDKGNITIRQLLNHTSGIAHYSSMLSAVSFKRYDNLSHALDKFKDKELLFMPGKDYHYTTYGYTVLGAIIENVTELSFQEYMDKYIWKPTNMNNTSLEDQNIVYENKAKLYINVNNQFIKSPNTDLSVKYPGGGIQSTAEDMLKFGKAIIDHHLIDSTSLATMMHIDSGIAKEGTPYGLGWFILSNDKEGRVIQHGGSQSGTSTFFKIYLDKKLVVITLANSFESDQEVYLLSKELADFALDTMSVSKPINFYEPKASRALKKYIGNYKNIDKEETFEFTLKRNQLYAELKPYPKLPVYPSKEGHFFYRHFDGKLIFSFLDNGSERTLKYYYKGKLSNFEKI